MWVHMLSFRGVYLHMYMYVYIFIYLYIYIYVYVCVWLYVFNSHMYFFLIYTFGAPFFTALQCFKKQFSQASDIPPELEHRTLRKKNVAVFENAGHFPWDLG